MSKEEKEQINNIIQNVIACTYAVQLWLEKDPNKLTLKEAFEISWHMEHNSHIWNDLTRAVPINPDCHH